MVGVDNHLFGLLIAHCVCCFNSLLVMTSSGALIPLIAVFTMVTGTRWLIVQSVLQRLILPLQAFNLTFVTVQLRWASNQEVASQLVVHNNWCQPNTWVVTINPNCNVRYGQVMDDTREQSI